MWRYGDTMTHWQRGEAEIERLIAEGQLERLHGPAMDGEPWLAKAQESLDGARILADDKPNPAYANAYDACRMAAWAVLAQQGLRATTKGGHAAAATAVHAQFGNAFDLLQAHRVRRNVMEYGTRSGNPADAVTATEAADAIVDAAAIIEAAELLLPNLSVF